MNTLFKILKKLTFVILLFSVVSCNKDSDEVIEFGANTDVYFLKKKSGNETQFARAYVVYGNNSIESAEVTTPEETTIELESIPESINSFAKYPSSDDFSPNIPFSGNYQFKVVSKSGETYEGSDDMVFENIDFPTIKTAGYVPELYAMKITWDLVSNADAYLVRLLDAEDNIVYNGILLNHLSTEYLFNESSSDWYSYPITNYTYTIQLQAFAFDENFTEEDYYYNIQEISISEWQVVWGMNS